MNKPNISYKCEHCGCVKETYRPASARFPARFCSRKCKSIHAKTGRGMSTCHPERIVLARGKCAQCYESWWRSQSPEQRNKVSGYSKAWQQRNPGQAKLNDMRQAAKKRTRLRQDPEYRLAVAFKYIYKKYNVTREWYEKRLAEQGGHCALCPATVSGNEKSLGLFCIDHDHRCCPKGSCGKCVRGLLCLLCNTGLGAFGERIESLLAAAKYLQTDWSK